MTEVPSLEQVCTLLAENRFAAAGTLDLMVEDIAIRLESSNDTLLHQLRTYFAHVCSDAGRKPAIRITLLEREPVETGLPFRDWPREPGKTGRKDSWFDGENYRLVRKLRTGMLFLQHQQRMIAAGPCLANDNQVINFINAQIMNVRQQRGDLLCHAAALAGAHGALAIAGLSGGGKSTLMLRMLEHQRLCYLTNDRLLLASGDDSVLVRGIPKLPRINPGTIVGNPRLHRLVSPAQLHEWRTMEFDALWHLEQKHDVLINEVYGPDRIRQSAALRAFLVLHWSHETDTPTRLRSVTLNERPELLGAIMKSAGPFRQFADGSFLAPDATLNRQAYLERLATIPVYELDGKADFASAETAILEAFGGWL